MKKTNKDKLTLKQARLLKELPSSNSVAEAGNRAGYHDRQTAHRALKGIAERAPEVLDRLGLTIEHVADNCLRPLLEATKTEFFQSNGIVMMEKEVAALDIRLRAIDTWAKLAGAYSVQKVNVTGNLNVTHASDEELDQAIIDLLGSAPQIPKA